MVGVGVGVSVGVGEIVGVGVGVLVGVGVGVIVGVGVGGSGLFIVSGSLARIIYPELGVNWEKAGIPSLGLYVRRDPPVLDALCTAHKLELKVLIFCA
jgi:hypothetical protein